MTLRHMWYNNVNWINVLLFSYFYPNDERLIATRCSTSGGISISDALNSIYEYDNDRPIMVFRDTQAVYEISQNYKDEVEGLIRETFGKSPEAVKASLEADFISTRDTVNPVHVDTFRSLFAKFPNLRMNKERNLRTDIDLDFECYTFVTTTWRVITFFAGYTYNHPMDRVLNLQLQQFISSLGYTRETDIRLFVQPFASDNMLSKLVNNARDKSIHVLDAVGMMQVQRSAELGGDLNGGNFTPEQMERVVQLTQGVGSGLIYWSRRWKRVIVIGA